MDADPFTCMHLTGMEYDGPSARCNDCGRQWRVWQPNDKNFLIYYTTPPFPRASRSST